MENETTAKKPSSKLPIIIGVVLLLLLGGGAYFLVANKTSVPKPQAVSTTPTSTPEQKTVFSSIQDAMSRSLSLQCDYTGADGTKTIAYVKSGSVRADVTGKTPEQSGSVLVKGNKLYFWNGKQGTTMTFDAAQMGKIAPSGQAPTGSTSKDSTGQAGSIVQNIEKYKDSCKPAAVSDSLFVVPTDVTFTDLSKMIPSGAMQLNEEQIKKLQEQYKQP